MPGKQNNFTLSGELQIAIRIPTPRIGRVLFFPEANESIDCAAERSEPEHLSPQSCEIAQDTMLYISDETQEVVVNQFLISLPIFVC
ncbi:hypothetical protein T4E_10733 [Trichinella pseudospiralis]|uniref:Uncharacterized protein n=1 Tax=Trichinella pseudospiralis TaxID=6337 RepID=A0A0V0Y7P6_TRIPS|nr:hypothetical protein T4E_10733 [Trichinella pseudospiralis]